MALSQERTVSSPSGSQSGLSTFTITTSLLRGDSRRVRREDFPRKFS